MQRCKKNREDPSRVICFHLLSFLLCAVDLEDLDTSIDMEQQQSEGSGSQVEHGTARTADSSH